MAITEENPGYKWVGTRPIRPDGLEKVTGKARFGADLALPGMPVSYTHLTLPTILLV